MSNKTILIIDDKLKDLRQMTMLLSQSGMNYNILTAQSIKDGDDMLRGKTPLNLAIIDINLIGDNSNDDSGFYKLTPIALAHEVPVIVITHEALYKYVRVASEWLRLGHYRSSVTFLDKFELKTKAFERTVSEILGSKKVFIVHGRNHSLRDLVAKFVSEMGLEPIILESQANVGRTLIEKFEEITDEVVYAIALLTGDDLGALNTQPSSQIAPELRARQNVILEVGYLTAKLGRHRISMIVEKGIEIPSDIHGIVYIGAKNFQWKKDLERELKALRLI